MDVLSRIRSMMPSRRPTAGEGHGSPEPGQVIAQHADALMRMPGVLSVGVGKTPDGRPAVIVGVMGDERVASSVPAELDGVPVIVRRTGRIDAL